MKLSVSVMMHPLRIQYKDYLISKLGNIPIIMDRGLGLWDTARRAWLSYDKTADYHLVIQDDAIICNDFYKRLEKILVSNKYIYNLYLGRRVDLKMKKIVDEGMKKGHTIVGWLIWGVGIIVPTKMVAEMVGFCDKITSPRLKDTDDSRINIFVRRYKIKVYYPLPSLLNHRQDGTSLIKHAINKGRRAFYFIDDNNT